MARGGRVAWLQQALPPCVVGGLDAHRCVDGEPAVVWPRLHRVRGIAVEQTAANEARQQAAAHGSLHRGDGLPVDPAGRVEDDAPGRRLGSRTLGNFLSIGPAPMYRAKSRCYARVAQRQWCT